MPRKKVQSGGTQQASANMNPTRIQGAITRYANSQLQAATRLQKDLGAAQSRTGKQTPQQS